MKKFSNDVLDKMDINGDGTRKYYVYGLINPCTYQVFYIGKGCGNRVFDHANDAIKSLDAADKQSLKITTIQNIIKKGKEVIPVIYHWGLTEEESLLIESTLIDAFSGLTNVQSGYDVEHGITSPVDLQSTLSIPVYEEPKDADGHIIPYMIIKLRDNIDERGGDLYSAVRGCWTADLNKVKGRYVLAVIKGIVRGVYEAEWQKSTTEAPRIEFFGKFEKNDKNEPIITKPIISNPIMLDLIGKRIPEDYRKKGASNPIQYSKDKD